MKRLLLLAFLLLLLQPVTARASGPLEGGTRVYLESEPLGPFTVTSFAAPNPPVSTDDLWVTVQVRDGAKAVTDAEVWVTVIPGDGREPQRMEARHDLAASPLDYTAYLDVSVAGSYEVLVEIEHPEGSGDVSYTVNVNEPLLKYILFGMALPFAVIAYMLVQHFGSRPPGSDRPGEEDEQLSEEALAR